MLRSYDVVFVSSNKNKYKEAKKILSNFGIRLGFFKYDLHEIQSHSIRDIASKKVTEAYSKCKKPVIVEDDGLFIESLNGFPGPFSSYVFKTIGNKGILRLVKTNRKAKFQSVISYRDKKNGIILFDAIVQGKISKNSHGTGWGYDPIFIPNGNNQTYAKIPYKNTISHRYKALKKFSSWFVRKHKSDVQ